MNEPFEVDIRVKLIRAERENFLSGKHVIYGEIFYLKKEKWNCYEGPYSLQPHHIESGDFKQWLEAGMVFIKYWR